jgi:hypothetical protein
MKKLLIFLGLIVCNLSYGQFFKEVDYVGATGNENWARDWTEFTPIGQEYPEAKIPLTGIISKNTVLTSANVYLLQGNVYVTNNATLYIEKGTVIRADSKSSIVITRGARIRAMGTKEKPIVFTSSKALNQRNKGDWNGIILLGRAKINHPAGENVAEGDLDPLYSKYGGKNDEDCSGTLNFVRIEFAGRRVSKDAKFSGLTVCGVGSRTNIENIEVSYSGNDGFHFFGGTVNCKYLVSFQSADDCFEYSDGYRGLQQFGIALRHFNLGDIAGSRAIESDTYTSSLIDLEILTAPKISNFTLISPEVYYNQSPNTNIKEAINLELGSALSLYNSLIIGFPIGITIDGTESVNHIAEEVARFRNNLFVGCGKPATVIKSGYDINTWFVTPEYKNVMRPKTDAENLFKSPFSMFKPNFITNYTGFVVTPDFRLPNKDLKRTEEFFEVNDYRGAFGQEDWTIGWSNFSPDRSYSADNKVTVSGNLSGNINWNQNTIYRLQGNVVVKNGAVLHIEPGTIVLGDPVLKGTLIVEPGATLQAEGDISHPIVFTSGADEGKKKPGDWGGLIILGSGKINPVKQPETLKNICSWMPDIFFGNMKTKDANNILKYVRVEYAGYTPDKTKDSYSLVTGANDNLKMEHVQVSYSAGDGFLFCGGTPQCKKIIAFNNTDDDIVCSKGYYGKIQYAFLWREPILAALNGSNAIEVSGCKGGEECMVNEQAEFSNFSIIGPNRKEVVQYNQNFKSAVLIKNGGSLSLNNSLLTSYPVAMQILGEESNFYALSNQLIFKNNIISNCKEMIKTDEKDPFFVTQWFMSDTQKKLIRSTYDDLGLTNTLSVYIKYIPKNDSPCMNSEFESFNRIKY